MKFGLITFLAIFFSNSYYAKAQGISINTTNSPADASSILDVSSPTKGILTPRMTSIERFAINNPADGLLVYDTDVNCFAVYKVSKWYLICGTIDPASVKKISIVSGDAQSNCMEQTLSSPILVELLDGNNNPIVGTSLNFTITSGGGSLSSVTLLTNALGQAQVNWTLGPLNGTQTLKVEGVGIAQELVSATAILCSPCGKTSDLFVDARDGEVYGTILLNGKRWMAENLRYNAAGSYSYSSSSSACYGRLYSWNSLMNGSSSSNATVGTVQGLCPAGWHLPTDLEWQDLEGSLGMGVAAANNTGWRGSNQGTQLKSTIDWIGSGNGSNSSGFDGLPAGYTSSSNIPTIGNGAFYWSATEGSVTHAFYRRLYYSQSNIYRAIGNKNNGFSCRCVEN